MSRISKLGLATMLFAMLLMLNAIIGPGLTFFKLIILLIGLAGALCFIIPGDKKS